MGLAGSFGDQNYQCKNCGHTMALYSPHCPKCLNKDLTKIKVEKGPGATSNRPSQEVADHNAPGVPSASSFGIVAGILVLFVALYTLFAKPGPQSVQDRSVQPVSRPERTSTRASQPVRHAPVRRAATPSRPANSNFTTATPARPMKLWQVTDSSGDAED